MLIIIIIPSIRQKKTISTIEINGIEEKQNIFQWKISSKKICNFKFKKKSRDSKQNNNMLKRRVVAAKNNDVVAPHHVIV